MKKKCNKCFIEKSEDQFFKDKNHSTGRYSLCKECKTTGTMAWREKNREKYNSDMRERNRKNVNKRRDVDLKRKYGITLLEYNKLLSDQGNVCAICQKTNKSSKRVFACDHDHKTGKARGILCYGCNRALHTLEHAGLLEKALEYLKSHS